ncbi:NAD(+)/NADH kinase [Candidatus Micrarchaeota archaeon]|nr:NAD(+)/NADH kinase [Candidatus Micrarchaeota archaeon]
MKIKIIHNPTKQWATDLAKELNAKLKKIGHQIVRKGADATICIGGDGTILFAHHKGRLEGSVLGIGSKTSYICQLRNDNWKEQIERILSEHKTFLALTLQTSINGKKYVAINDFVIHASNYRVLDMEVEGVLFEGDGVIVSTGVGSAAYAYSAGGERYKPEEEKIQIVPICAYKRRLIAKTFGGEKEIEIKVGKNCAFIGDGILLTYLKEGEKMRIKRGENITFFEGVGTNDK